MVLAGKNILLGVTGSIAAYKAAVLVRSLVRQGAQVRVVMTPLSKQFITPLTMATLSRNPILVDFFDPENGAWNSHVSLGEWADLYLIAPASANTIAKMAHGVADNLLLTTYLSARCPVAVAPAMDLDMYAHPATQQNIGILRDRGVAIIEPGEGELASGLSGKGRMAEPEEIVARIAAWPELQHELQSEKKNSVPEVNSEISTGVSDKISVAGRDITLFMNTSDSPLRGKRFIVTAGGTIEAIDPVRYISNHSTGKMGYAIAAELASRGAAVILISAPTALPVPHGVERVDVVSAADMYEAFMARFSESDGAVMCAAVADYTPAEPAASKIKKKGDEMTLRLSPTRDIAAAAGKVKGSRVLVGFALETEAGNGLKARVASDACAGNSSASGGGLENARSKMERKNFDFIVFNSLADKGAGFGGDTNKIAILDRTGEILHYPLESKSAAAARIADKIESYLD